ncbi:hypothetical protein BS47DRAFT_1358944 [Hydnum rufescens UP504]|uniref:Uncharacterized protein n=1 Tax=Hydnum rufescens UP504 TaxID=1448309 RepID=A0A9P6B661_9AGAM|nr:hypothetical protein BS47DRAFT_1358944 [Hydnum rufescens UP504]
MPVMWKIMTMEFPSTIGVVNGSDGEDNRLTAYKNVLGPINENRLWELFEISDFKISRLPKMSDNESPHTDPDQPALDRHGNLKDPSLLELDISPDTLAAKACLVAKKFPHNLGYKSNHTTLSYDLDKQDSDEVLRTSIGDQHKRLIKKVAHKDIPSQKRTGQELKLCSTTKKSAGVHAAFAAFGINSNNLKTLGAGEPIHPHSSHNAKKKVSAQRAHAKGGGEMSRAWRLAKRKAMILSDSDNESPSDKSCSDQQATKKQHVNDINSDTDEGLCTQDNKAAEFATADKASAVLIAESHPKKSDATHNLDGVFGRPEVHKNLDKQVDELMQACLVCMLHCERLKILMNNQAVPSNIKDSCRDIVDDATQSRITQFGVPMQQQDQWNADTLHQLIENFILETDQIMVPKCGTVRRNKIKKLLSSTTPAWAAPHTHMGSSTHPLGRWVCGAFCFFIRTRQARHWPFQGKGAMAWWFTVGLVIWTGP